VRISIRLSIIASSTLLDETTATSIPSGDSNFFVCEAITCFWAMVSEFTSKALATMKIDRMRITAMITVANSSHFIARPGEQESGGHWRAMVGVAPGGVLRLSRRTVFALAHECTHLSVAFFPTVASLRLGCVPVLVLESWICTCLEQSLGASRIASHGGS